MVFSYPIVSIQHNKGESHMFALFFLVAFVSAHNHEDIKKSFENMCGMPGNTSRLLHSAAWNEKRCQKHVSKTIEKLEKEHLSHDEKKDIKKLFKEIKEDLKKEHGLLEHYSDTPWTIYILDKTKFIALTATLTSLAIFYLGNRDIATVTAPIGAGFTLAGASAHTYKHKEWVHTIKRNYKFIKKAGDNFN